MKDLSRKLSSVVIFIVCAMIPLASQTASTQKPSFDVVSVKPSAAGSRGITVRSSGGRFSATATLRLLLQIAYGPGDGIGFGNSRIIGAPGWTDTDRFDIVATTEEAAAGPIPREKLQPMLQSLLEDRFQLKVHQEVREMPVYLLTVGKGGSKLKLSEDQTGLNVPQPPNTPIEQRRGMIRRTQEGMTANAVPLSFLLGFLSSQTGRPVLDKTGLEGMYDFTLHWAPSPLPAPGAPVGPEVTPPAASDPSSSSSIFTAIQELGLKLESAKAPLEVIVVDSVQKPSDN